MLNRIHHRLIMVLFYSDLHATRFTLGLAELLWAVTLLWPGDTFGRPTYTAMAHVLSEECWGATFLVSSLFQFRILIKGEYHSKLATCFAGWNCALWLFVTVSMYMSVFPPPAAISGEAALASAAGWVWVRSGYIIKGRRQTDYRSKK